VPHLLRNPHGVLASGQHHRGVGVPGLVSERLGDPVALQARLGHKLDNARTVAVRNGVAIVPVTGPIFRYANMFTEISGATSTKILATDIRQALDNPAVKAIVLNIDSPGGVASGINELAD
jgi:ClpP class serine protease